MPPSRSVFLNGADRQRLYRIALFSAAACVAVAGHFGAVLVWGADFLRP